MVSSGSPNELQHSFRRQYKPQTPMWSSVVAWTTGINMAFCSLLPLIVHGKEGSFAEVSMTSDSELRKTDKEGFCENPTPKINSLDRKP